MSGQSSIKSELKQDLEQTRQHFHHLLQSIPDAKWRSGTGHPTWNVAAMMFHMTVALQFLPEDVRVIRHLKSIPRPPAWIFHTLNDLYTRFGGWRSNPQSVAERYDKQHRRVINLLESLAEADLEKGTDYPGWDPLLAGFVTIEDLFRCPHRHFQAHAGEIRGTVDFKEVS